MWLTNTVADSEIHSEYKKDPENIRKKNMHFTHASSYVHTHVIQLLALLLQVVFTKIFLMRVRARALFWQKCCASNGFRF